MGIVKIFYKDDCPMCPMAKKLKDNLREMNISVDDYNVGTTDGLAEATFYRVMALPTILVEDDFREFPGGMAGKCPSYR